LVPITMVPSPSCPKDVFAIESDDTVMLPFLDSSHVASSPFGKSRQSIRRTFGAREHDETSAKIRIIPCAAWNLMTNSILGRYGADTSTISVYYSMFCKEHLSLFVRVC